jgi:RNA polymerase sigma factor (sigma-70 family)
MALLETHLSPTEIAETLDSARPRLKEILRRYRIPPEDAEDLLQETFLITLAKWYDIQNKEAWLAATLRNRCLMYWRARRSPHTPEPTDIADLETLIVAREPPQLQVHHARHLNKLLAILPPRQRLVLLLRCGLELSPLEVAERLGYHPASVRKMVRRALDRLRRAIDAEPTRILRRRRG